MPLDYERLLGFALPRRKRTLTRRDTAFYALAVGMGQDPLDEAQLAFVDPDRELVALPSMATVLAHPGFWLADPALAIDYAKALYGEQVVVLHRPLPIEGELYASTRVTGIVDKGVNRAALIYAEHLVCDSYTAEALATVESTIVLRDGGGFGGPAGPVRALHTTPERPHDVAIDLATRPEQALFYRFNGDDNPLHVDPSTAARAGFSRPILHGLCTFGVVCHALVRALCGYDPSRIRRLEARFSAPVFPGETIRTEIWADGSFRARVLERDVLVVMNGRADLGD